MLGVNDLTYFALAVSYALIMKLNIVVNVINLFMVIIY
jgi:hypothetical protein